MHSESWSEFWSTFLPSDFSDTRAKLVMRKRGAAVAASRKRAVPPPRNKEEEEEEEDNSYHTLEKRRKLKRSVETGVIHIHHSSIGNDAGLSCKDLIHSDGALRVLGRSPPVGSGVYGDARKLCGENPKHTFVAKVTGCYSPLLGSLGSPFRSENVEPRMLHMLYEHVVEPGRSPHIIVPVSEHVIVDGFLQDRKKSDADIKNSMIFVMETASGRDVRSFLSSLWGRAFEASFLSILFQVCYTLQAIYNVFPNFRHNDLQDANVFLHAITTKGHTRYTLHLPGDTGGGETFYVPNASGAFALIADMDFSCIGGRIDNYKVLEHEFNTPTFNIGTRRDQASDVYLFLKYCMGTTYDRFPRTLKDKLREAWGQRGPLPDGTHVMDAFVPQRFKRYGKVDKSGNSYRMPGHLVSFLPTVSEILSSSLFDGFRTPLPDTDHVLGHYNATVPIESELRACGFPLWNPDRHLKNPKDNPLRREAPLLKPRYAKDFQTTKAPPSMAHFATWATHPQQMDSRSSNYISTYKPTFTPLVLKSLRVAYDAQPDDKKDISGHGYDPERWGEFSTRLVAAASRFIEAVRVPKPLWMAVYTCAFVDVSREMGLTPMGQNCWDIESWAHFWAATFDETVYTPQKLLHFVLQWTWYRDLMLLERTH